MLDIFFDIEFWMTNGRIWLAIPITIFAVLAFIFIKGADGGELSLPFGRKNGKSRMPKGWRKRDTKDDSPKPRPTFWK